MIFRLGQIITIGILGGAGGYLIYKSKPSTRRIEAEYYEKLEEEKRLQKENGINPSETFNANNQKEELASSSSKSNSSVMDSIKTRTNQLKTKTNQLKTKIQEKTPKINKETNNDEEASISRNRFYSNFYENYRKSNDMLLKGKENAGIRRRYEDMKRIHNYCKSNRS